MFFFTGRRDCASNGVKPNEVTDSFGVVDFGVTDVVGFFATCSNGRFPGWKGSGFSVGTGLSLIKLLLLAPTRTAVALCLLKILTLPNPKLVREVMEGVDVDEGGVGAFSESKLDVGVHLGGCILALTYDSLKLPTGCLETLEVLPAVSGEYLVLGTDEGT